MCTFCENIKIYSEEELNKKFWDSPKDSFAIFKKEKEFLLVSQGSIYCEEVRVEEKINYCFVCGKKLF